MWGNLSQHMHSKRVAVVIVTYGERWKFLHEVLDAVVDDVHTAHIIVVDNASKNGNELREYAAVHDKVHVIRNETNKGSAGGYHQALSQARECKCDFVLMLDDDNVPEQGAMETFLSTYKFFSSKKVVLLGNRHNLPNTESLFHKAIASDAPRLTFFTVFSFAKLMHFFKMFFPSENTTYTGPFMPIVPTEAFAYGGAFIPIEAIHASPLPDPTLILYGDDVEYSWNVKKAGYSTYLCHSPLIHDIDTTFGGSHIFGLFEAGTRDFTVYYRIRNMVRLSVRHSKQNKIVLALSVATWIAGLLTLGFLKAGITSLFLKRAKLVLRATYDGYHEHAPLPKEAQLP
jgi:GT2 family glycosyltransferase